MNEEDKQRIREEEIFRAEVRASLEQQNAPKKNRVLEFLNSSLGIWFLSSVIVGVFGFAYNKYTQSQAEKTENERRIRSLDLEIENRVSQFWVNVEKITKKSGTNYSLDDSLSVDTIRTLWLALKNPPCSACNHPPIISIRSEFENRSLASLIIELNAILPLGSDDKADKNEDLHQISRNIADDMIFEKFREHPTTRNLWLLFKKHIIRARWQHLFPHTNCGDVPFC